MQAGDDSGALLFYHGTKASLEPGAQITVGYKSNYGSERVATYVYFTATLDAAIWGAELAIGEGVARIYLVEPTGPAEDDPHLTNAKFPGNPTKSYRSRHPLRVTGEVEAWQGHSAEQLQSMKEGLERLKQQGIEAVDE